MLLTGLVGVPWQSLEASVDASGTPVPAPQLRFKSATELAAVGDTTWAQVLGTPGVRWQAAEGEQAEVESVPATPPTLPQMLESDTPRAGVMAGNLINGREYDTTSLDTGVRDDLQYACIFPMSRPIDCVPLEPFVDQCSCFPGDVNRPLCEQIPGQSAPGTVQYWDRAYPGARQLEVLKGYGDNAVVASICPRNMAQPALPDFGYRPAMGDLLERLQLLGEP